MGGKTQLEDRQQAEASEPMHWPSDNIKPIESYHAPSFSLSLSFVALSSSLSCSLSFSLFLAEQEGGEETLKRLRNRHEDREIKKRSQRKKERHNQRKKGDKDEGKSERKDPIFPTKLGPWGACIKHCVRQTSPFTTLLAYSEGRQPPLIFHGPANRVRRCKLTGNCDNAPTPPTPLRGSATLNVTCHIGIVCLSLDHELHMYLHV